MVIPQRRLPDADQCSRRLVGQKSLVVECLAKGSVDHPSEMAARTKKFS